MEPAVSRVVQESTTETKMDKTCEKHDRGPVVDSGVSQCHSGEQNPAAASSVPPRAIPGEGLFRLECRLTLFGPPRPNKPRDLILINPICREGIRACAEGRAPWPLFLTGEAGAGKTCAALCLIDWYGGWFLTLADLCELHREAQLQVLCWSSGYARTGYEVQRDWRDANLTVLDELAMRETPSDFHTETLHRALDAREGKPAVYISNLNIKAVDGVYGDRIASRLSSGTTITFVGDRRIQRNDHE